MIGVVDYGLGNIKSLVNALRFLGAQPALIGSIEELNAVDRVILPGVGAFGAAMANIESRDLRKVIESAVERKLPMLGICLGMQVLAASGFEGERRTGLGLIEGEVNRIEGEPELKLPHVGWNSLAFPKPHPIFRGIGEKVDFYFVHSYALEARAESDVIATTDYGQKIVAAVARGSVAGVQFHPEKSQRAGLKLLENFLEWDGSEAQ